jgi:hypothetical protein
MVPTGAGRLITLILNCVLVLPEIHLPRYLQAYSTSPPSLRVSIQMLLEQMCILSAATCTEDMFSRVWQSLPLILHSLYLV